MKRMHKLVEAELNSAFWKWFKGSKVVDSSGQPLIVFHWTNSKFNTFELSSTGSNNDYGMWGKGFYFSPIRKFGRGYGSNIMEVYLSLQNPLIVRKISQLPPNLKPVIGRENALELRNNLIALGYDGVFQYEGGERKPWTQIVAFYPNQIKSAISNNGDYSRSDNINEQFYGA